MSNPEISLIPPATGFSTENVGYAVERRIGEKNWLRGDWTDLYHAVNQRDAYVRGDSPQEVRIVKITLSATVEVMRDGSDHA